jgi:hypothetical protein
MSLLIKKAAKQAWDFNQKAYEQHALMSDHIHDLKMHLEENKDQENTKGEVEPSEAATLMNDCVKRYELMEVSMRECNEWLTAIIHSN